MFIFTIRKQQQLVLQVQSQFNHAPKHAQLRTINSHQQHAVAQTIAILLSRHAKAVRQGLIQINCLPHYLYYWVLAINIFYKLKHWAFFFFYLFIYLWYISISIIWIRIWKLFQKSLEELLLRNTKIKW